MQNSALRAWLDSSYLSGSDQSWIEQLYEDFLTDPDSVDANWRSTFQQLPDTGVKPDRLHSEARNYLRWQALIIPRHSSSISDPGANAEQVKVLQSINAYRFHDHQHANLDPLGLWQQENTTDLDLPFYDLTGADLQKSFSVGSFTDGRDTTKLSDLIIALKQACCDPINAEYMHIASTEEKCRLQQRTESGHAALSNEERKRFLNELTAVEGLERYLGAEFPGARRLSLEGSDALAPMLKEMIRHVSNNGTRETILGMAHHGHLNVLINILGKHPQELFDRFTGKHRGHLGTGDVKYHTGFSSNIEAGGDLVHLILAFNPSHLEVVNPIVVGSVRTRLDRLDEPNSNKVLPVTIHGDAAVTEQDVAQETPNISKAHGYEVGGIVCIVTDNQVGFTTSNSLNARPTPYYTDIGKVVQVPIFHVSAGDPETVAFMACLALGFHSTSRRDVLIDLACYRHHGHNEIDKPSAARPLMY